MALPGIKVNKKIYIPKNDVPLTLDNIENLPSYEKNAYGYILKGVDDYPNYEPYFSSQRAHFKQDTHV